jgi:hypothetical protein
MFGAGLQVCVAAAPARLLAPTRVLCVAWRWFAPAPHNLHQELVAKTDAEAASKCVGRVTVASDARTQPHSHASPERVVTYNF